VTARRCEHGQLRDHCERCHWHDARTAGRPLGGPEPGTVPPGSKLSVVPPVTVDPEPAVESDPEPDPPKVSRRPNRGRTDPEPGEDFNPEAA
jgi:hypothetical protein